MAAVLGATLVRAGRIFAVARYFFARFPPLHSFIMVLAIFDVPIILIEGDHDEPMNNGDLIRSARQFLQHMPDPIYILDLDRRIVWVNDAFQRLFGYTADELNQEPTRFTLPGGEDAAVCLYRKDGTPVYARCCLVPIPNEDKETAAYSVVLKQCEEPHPAGPLVSKSEERYKIVAENTSDTIVLVDNEAIVRYVSPSIKTISGYSVEDYEGMDAFDVIHPDDADRVRFLHAEAIRSKLPVDCGNWKQARKRLH